MTPGQFPFRRSGVNDDRVASLGGPDALSFPAIAMAQTKESLVGEWKPVSVTETTEKGEVKHPLGQHPLGF